MEISKKVINKLGVIPKLELAHREEGKAPISTGIHKIKLLKDELIKAKDYMTGKEIQVVKYTVEENGVAKTYNVPIFGKDGSAHYLVIKLSQYSEGDEITMEYQRKGISGFIAVSKVGEELPSIDYGDEFESGQENQEVLGKEGSVDIRDPLEVESNPEI